MFIPQYFSDLSNVFKLFRPSLFILSRTLIINFLLNFVSLSVSILLEMYILLTNRTDTVYTIRKGETGGECSPIIESLTV